LVIALLLAMAPAPFLRAAEITGASAIEVSGKDAQLGVTFHARRDRWNVRNAADEVYLVDIDVAGVKRLSARLNYSSQSLSIKFRYIASGNPVRIGSQDIKTFRRLDQAMPQLNGRAGDALLALISYIAEAPANATINISAGPAPAQSGSWTSLCGQVGTRQSATYDKFSNTVVVKKPRLSQCYEQATACFGRCGKGCNRLQPARMQRFTQDCFNHDLCVRDLGDDAPACADEFYAAADDFFYATDCGSMAGFGAWTDAFANQYRLKNAAGTSFTGTLTTPACGNYDLQGSRPGGSKFTLSSSQSLPPPGCCSSAAWTGALTSCSSATFDLTDCQGNTTFDVQMTRGAPAASTAKR
jgi:hypothetical protein